MAIDMFLNIENKRIKGECVDKTHGDTIQVLTWTWGASRSIGPRQLEGGRVRGRVGFTDMTFTKFVDRSTPLLLEALGNAALYKDAKLILRKAGGAPLEYLIYTMEQVMVSSVTAGVNGIEDRQIETVTLNFLRMTASYQAQAADGGKAGGIVEATINAAPQS